MLHRKNTTSSSKASSAKKGPSAQRYPASSKGPLLVDDLEVWVTRKRIKNMHLRVKPPCAAASEGRVEVSAPYGTSDGFIASMVRERRTWIEAQRQQLANSPRTTAAAATPEEQAEWKALVMACVPALIAKWEPILGVKTGKLAYRNMTSRWGSCQPTTGRICINTRLALYPPECLEYVVVHELCHLLERGHTPRFWALVEHALPHWREARTKLREG